MTIATIPSGSRGFRWGAVLQYAAHRMGVILTYNSNHNGAEDVVRTIKVAGDYVI
jgi:hypothetical protein